jgi:hypothetical protein
VAEMKRRVDRIYRWRFQEINDGGTYFTDVFRVHAEAVTRIQIISLPKNCQMWKFIDNQTQRVVSDWIPRSIKDVSCIYQFQHSMVEIRFELNSAAPMDGFFEFLITCALMDDSQ